MHLVKHEGTQLNFKNFCPKNEPLCIHTLEPSQLKISNQLWGSVCYWDRCLHLKVKENRCQCSSIQWLLQCLFPHKILESSYWDRHIHVIPCTPEWFQHPIKLQTLEPSIDKTLKRTTNANVTSFHSYVWNK